MISLFKSFTVGTLRNTHTHTHCTGMYEKKKKADSKTDRASQQSSVTVEQVNKQECVFHHAKLKWQEPARQIIILAYSCSTSRGKVNLPGSCLTLMFLLTHTHQHMSSQAYMSRVEPTLFLESNCDPKHHLLIPVHPEIISIHIFSLFYGFL